MPLSNNYPSKEKTLYSWTSPARPFKQRSKEFYINMIAIAFLLAIILFLIEGFMPILLMISLLFLFYVMSTIKPGDINYKITNFGIYINNVYTPWSQMGRFWFTNRFGNETLIIEVQAIPGRSEFIINPSDKLKIESILSRYLVHEQIPPSIEDKLINFSSRFMPK